VAHSRIRIAASQTAARRRAPTLRIRDLAATEAVRARTLTAAAAVVVVARIRLAAVVLQIGGRPDAVRVADVAARLARSADAREREHLGAVTGSIALAAVPGVRQHVRLAAVVVAALRLVAVTPA